MKTFLKSDSSFLWLVFTWIIGCGLPWPRYPISLDNSTYFKEKLCLPQWISRCLWPSTFPREAKSKGSQTSYFIIISNEWGSLPFPVDILIDTSVPDMSEYVARFTTGIRHLLLQVLSGETACECGQDLGNSPTPRLFRTLCKDAGTLCQDAAERSRDFIHSSQTSIKNAHTPTSMICAVKRSDIHAWPGTGKDRLLWLFWQTVVYSWLDTLQLVGLDYRKPFFKVLKSAD